MKSVYKKLVSFRDAVDTAFREAEKVDGTEKCGLFDSVGRILAENIYAPRNNPPFNRSTMDGYAVHYRSVSEASEDGPVKLDITGESFIGEARKELSGENSCFKISTGAIVPSGADAVVKVESTNENEGFVEIFESVGPSENIAESGSDISAGELLLAEGKELETHDIAVLASLGISKVEVLRKLKVQVISTGNELISYDQPYAEGKINDANGVVVTSELNSFKCFESVYSGIVGDEYSEIRNAMDNALERNDVVILSGGSSAGESDLVYRIIEEFSPGMIFHGVLVKPGLPTVFGKKGKKILIGLPGFPVSALMIFRSIFLTPLLRSAGSTRVPSNRVGKLGVNLRLDVGRQNLIPVSMSSRDDPRAYPVTGLSGSITRFTSTSGFISVPGNTKFIEAGSPVEVTGWNNEIQRGLHAFSGIFIKGISDGSLSGGCHMEYTRMLPRESLKSLINGDSDFSTFIALSGTDIRNYVSRELGDLECQIYEGKGISLVIASGGRMDGIGPESFEKMGGNSLTGPSLRMLKNIVNSSDALRSLISSIEENLTSYTASDMKTAAECTSQGKFEFCLTTHEHATGQRLNAVKICDLRPVFVIPVKNMDLSSRFLDLKGMRQI